MKLATGVDLIEIERIRASLEKHGERFLKRVFTSVEIEDCAGREESLAARWAAKEAVAKALGCGIGDISFQEIEVLRGETGQPQLLLHGAAYRKATELGLTDWSISLSHNQSQAIAVVVALG